MRKRWKGVGMAALAMLALGNVAFATNESKTGVVQKNDVNIRSEASVDSKVLGVLNENSKVTIVGSKNSFYEISWEGKTAYIFDDYVDVSTVSSQNTGTINAKYVILRSEATTDSKKVTKLDKNATVSIQGEENGFYQVKTENESGYVSKEYVDVKAESKLTTEQKNTGAVETNNSSTSTTGTSNASMIEVAEVSSNVSTETVQSQSGAKTLDDLQIQPITASSTAVDPSTIVYSEEEDTLLLLIEEEEDTGIILDSSDPQSVEYQVEVGSYTEEELDVLARLIQAEGNTSDESLEAIASVVYNRLVSSKFPDTVEGVVFQKSQFTVTNNRSKFDSIEPTQAAKDAIEKVFVQGIVTLPPDVMYFKSSRLSKSWGSRVYYKTIDGNMFYT